MLGTLLLLRSASEMNVVAPVEKCWECDGREEVAGIGVGSDSA